jgi:hypothetical protein
MQPSKVLIRTVLVITLLAGLSAGVFASTLLSVQASPQALSAIDGVVINQIQFRGSNGSNSSTDEFISLINNSDGTVDLNGSKIRMSDASGTTSDLYTFTMDVILLPGNHFLLANYSGYDHIVDVPADVTFSGDIPDDGGIALLDPHGNVQDQVGLSIGSAYKEGTPLTHLTTNVDRGYERKNSGCTDTNNNFADFSLVNPITPINSADTPTDCSALLTSLPITETASAVNLTATASSVNLTGTASAVNLTATASSVNLTGTASAVCSTGSYSSLSLVINEVGWMGTSSTTTGDEWVELYNPGACPIPLNGWTFTIEDTSTDIGLAGTINAHGYFLLVQNDSVFRNITAYNYKTFSNLSLTNDGEALRLTSPTGAIIDTANWWDGYWPAGIASDSNSTRAYSSMERYYPPGGSISSDSTSAWVTFAGPTANTPLDRNGNHVHGTPGGLNWAYTVTETPTPKPTSTRAPTPTFAPTPVPAVVLNEILPRPGSDWNGDGLVDNNDEFIEIENLGPGIVDLKNWKLSVMPNNGSGSFSLPSTKLNPNDRIALFGSTTQLLLQDSGETVSLTDSRNVIEDAFTYPPALQPDDSWCRIRDGIGEWRDGCFPTPGHENTLSGITPPLPPQPAEVACQLPDSAPDEFRLAECSSFGGGIWNQQYWDELSGQNEYAVPDPKNKWGTFIQ